jgi:hypothetical protein
LVSIESLACGTPVLARRVGALPEIIRDGVDGFFGDDAAAIAFYADRVGTLDRREIRERVVERFSAVRMTDRYEELYARMAARGPRVASALRARMATPDDAGDGGAVGTGTKGTAEQQAAWPDLPDAELTDLASLAELATAAEAEGAAPNEYARPSIAIPVIPDEDPDLPPPPPVVTTSGPTRVPGPAPIRPSRSPQPRPEPGPTSVFARLRNRALGGSGRSGRPDR